jgi:hypothetical protein
LNWRDDRRRAIARGSNWKMRALRDQLGLSASLAVHIAALAASLGYAGSAILNASAVEPVPISLVSPAEAEKATGAIPLPEGAEPDRSASKPDAPKHDAAPVPPPGAPLQTPQSDAAQPAYTPAQPDLSLRYQVDLGLKQIAATVPPSDPGGHDDFDDPSVAKAEIASSAIASFRAHLRQCAALPAGLSRDDKVVIVLRAAFRPDGRLAGAPILIEASASSKGPALMQAAMAALQTCQPHNALPRDKFAEWRMLDLRFTPQDFGG